MRELVGAASLLLGVAVAIQAHADPAQDARAAEAEACFTAAETAQPLIKQRKLRAAQDKLAFCARDACPKAARTDCRAWLDDVTRAVPTVILIAREQRGRTTSPADDTRVSIDGGEVVVARLDGSPVPLDPGPHVVRFEREGFGAIEKSIDLREGEKDQRVEAVFRPSVSEPGAPASSSVTAPKTTAVDRPRKIVAAPTRADPTAAFVFAGVGIVGLGVGAYFEAKGLSDRAHLESTCKPTRTCAPSDVDAARARVLVGDLTIGASAIVLAAAAYMVFARDSAPRHSSAARLYLDVRPLPGGAAAGLSGSLW